MIKRREFLDSAFAGLVVAANPRFTFAAEQSQQQLQHLGRLAHFWRNSAVLGPFLEIGGGGLMEIPPYMSAGDFPYRKRPYVAEVPFADQLSVVRLLGGYVGDPSGSKDLAYRDPSGKIQYRMELLGPRLQPYLENGYNSLTLVMDNTPWCFPEHPVAPPTGLGQAAPPRNEREWYTFIQTVCRQLVQMVGFQVAQQMRFRVGTEDDSEDRFTGTQSQFVWFYETTAAAVASVLPNAQVGPFNISGPTVPGVERYDHVRTLPLAERCVFYPNVFNNSPRTRFDWVAFSKYFRAGDNPQTDVAPCRDVWNLFATQVPPLRSASREIHEFGIAPFAGNGAFVSAEPGALGATLTCCIMLGLIESGIDRLWHWPGDIFDQFRDGQNQLRKLATSQAWLLSVLERMAGGDYFVFPSQQGSNGTQSDIVAAVKQTESIFLVTSYNADIELSNDEHVQFRVPRRLVLHPAFTAQTVYLSKQAAVHDRIRRDLQDAGLLNQDFVSHPYNLGTVLQMGGTAAAAFVGNRWDTYIEHWTKSLTLGPLPPDVGTISEDANGVMIRLRMTPPMMVALVM